MIKKAMWLSLLGLAAIGMLTLAAWADGEQEENVTLDQVPAAVRATILKESAGGEITEIERETKDGQTTYEAEIQREGQEIDIKIAADGTLLGREVEGQGNENHDTTIDQVPEPARAALLEIAGGATIVKVVREREHGAVVYEAKWVKNGNKHEAAVTAAGALLEIEQIVPIGEVPAAVRAAMVSRFGPHTEMVVEKRTIVIYEVNAKVNGKEVELLVLPTGYVHDEHGAGHDDDGDDGDDDDGDDDDDDDGEEDDD